MGKVSYLTSNFSRGELSPRMAGRPDTEQYYMGAEGMKQYAVTPFGGAEMLPGFRMVSECRDHSKKSRKIPFEFSNIQAYELEFSDLKIRFFKDGGIITLTPVNVTGATKANPCKITAIAHGLSNGDTVFVQNIGGMTQLNGRLLTVSNATGNDFEALGVDSTNYDTFTSGGTIAKVYEITSPYLEADLFNIQYAQDNDTMILTARGYQTRQLTRTGHTSWTLANIAFVPGAVQDPNETATTIAPSADTGAGITLTASTAIFVAGHVGSIWRVKNGYVKITAFTDTTHVTGDVQAVNGVAGNLGTGPGAVLDWGKAAWSDADGWPECCIFHEGRLYLGNTLAFPKNGWGSVVDDYVNFKYGANDDDAVAFTIRSRKANPILWFESGQVLGIGTLNGIASVSSGATSDAITPANIHVKTETSYGAKQIMPVRVGNFVYYVSRGGRKLRELRFHFDQDEYVAEEKSLLSEHITKGGIVEVAYQQEPYSIVWCVTGNGKLIALTIQPDETVKVSGWTEISTDGSFESVSVIPRGDYDEVWVVVKRTIGGVTKRYIEILDPFPDYSDMTQLFYVHSGLSYNGASTTVITGLWHLEGKIVSILVNGAVHTQKTVTNGKITLDWAGTKVQVGLPNTPQITLMRPEPQGGSSQGTTQGDPKRIARVILRVYNSSGGKISMKGGKKTDPILSRSSSLPMDAPPPLVTDDVEVPVPGGYDKKGQLVITQDQPLPLNILCVIHKMETNEP